MVPANLDQLFFNLLSSLATSPIYAFISLGVLGTNISRNTFVRRISGNIIQGERSDSIIYFIGPSRVGKGVAVDLVSRIGSKVEDEWRLSLKHISTSTTTREGKSE